MSDNSIINNLQFAYQLHALKQHPEHSAKPGSQPRELPVIIAGRKTCPDRRKTLPLRACMNMTPGRRRRKRCELSWRFIYAACQVWA
jgi:hypothetical protein